MYAVPCPWYRNGLCTSPLLESPSADPVIPQKCLSEVSYRDCKYYKETGKEEVTTLGFGKPLLLIHSLSKKPQCNCEFLVIIQHESGAYIAGCKVLCRYLTRYEVKLCEKKWQECPFRKVGIKLSQQLI